MPKQRAPLTLRTKLVSVSVLLAFVVTATVGVVSILSLQRSLQTRLDTQLSSAFDRAVIELNAPGFRVDSESIEQQPDANGGTGNGTTDAARILNGPAQAPGTLALVLNNGTLTGGYLGEDGQILAIGETQLAALSKLTPDALPHTLALGDELGLYRVQGAIVDDSAVIVGLPLRDVRETVLTLTGTIATVTALGLLVLALLAVWIIRRTMRPLERVAAAADTVAALELDRGEVGEFAQISVAGVDERTEVGRVMTAVNSMMQNVESALISREASEQKVRSFVADASHELRTPLASIRGYSELVRRMDGKLPKDVQQAIGRIESESVRMTELVEDLLLLARLDEGQELTLAEVDLAQLATDAVGDAAVAGPDHVWGINGAEHPVAVLGDSNRLHQVLVNLLSNARMHTPAGTEVTVTVAQQDDEAQLTVADNGPGIDPELQETVFARFVRGDSSRTKQSAGGGTGLGLSIVKALVDAHHGSVTVTSEPGSTQFVIQLPLA